MEFNGTIEERQIEALCPYAGNARTHSKRQIRQIEDSIRRFGFTNLVLIADDDTILAGHGRVKAARNIGMTRVASLTPVPSQRRRAARLRPGGK